MSLKSEGVDLNSEVASTEENETLMLSNPGDPGEVGGFSVDGDRVLGELNDSSNSNALINEGLKEEEMMESVNRDASLEIGMEGNNGGSESKEGYSVREGGDSGQENSKSDSKMDVEIKCNENAEVEDKVAVDRNQETGMRDSLQNPNQGVGIGLIVDLNSRYQDETRNEGAESTEGFIEVNLPFSVGLVVNMDTPINDGGFTLIEEGVTSGQSNEVDGKEDKPGVLKPNIPGIENRTEKEGEFYVSDLVWGKVRSHPWWPGLIIEPSAASEKAIKYFKKDSYLIAYFGDQTFAWNEVSQIKPFRMHFWPMKNQSSAEAFCHAVDGALAEVSRRVEFGLTCQCLPEEVSSKVKSHVVANAGVRGGSTCIYGGDSLSMADSFIPAELVRFLEALAESPHSDIDMLEFTIARAQLLAFSRWKGYYQLPVLEELSGMLGNDPELHDQVIEDNLGLKEDDQIVSRKGKSPLCSISQVRMHPTMSNKRKGRKKRRLLDLMSGSSSSFPNGENDYNGKSSSESLLATKKHKAVDSAFSESRKERLGISMQRTSNTNLLIRNNMEVGEQFDGVAVTIGEGIRPLRSGTRSSKRALVNHGGISMNTSSSGASTLTAEETRRGRATRREYPPTSEVFTKLCAAAESPMEGCSSLTSVAGFFCDFRNSICLEYDKRKRKTKLSRKQKVEKLSELEITEAFAFEGTEDSYWTDRIIQSNFDEQILFEPGTPDEKDVVVAEQEGLDGTNFNIDTQHEMNPVVIELDADGNTNEYSPTTLILNFTDLESVPSITNLNNIFKRYGSLEESQTQILSNSKRAKVVFKRRPDAETAFSSTGKFSIFGPSLVSYRLNYKPIPPKASSSSKTKRGRKKATSSVKDSAI